MKRHLSPKQVAQAIGVSESSVKRWCDRGVLDTIRTGGGHRRLRIDAVVQFLRREGRRIVDPAALGFPTERAGQTLDESAAKFCEALVQGHEQRARGILIDLYVSRHTISVISDEVVARSFHRIGDLWDCGDVDIYQERRACQIALAAIRDLRKCLPPTPAEARVAIGATVDGDPYSVAVALGELVLRENGWNATLLGSSIATESLQQAMRTYSPRLCWLSVSYIEDLDEFVASTRSLYETASRDGVALAVRGRALDAPLRRRIRYNAFCDTLQHLEQFAATL